MNRKNAFIVTVVLQREMAVKMANNSINVMFVANNF
jgi:hypothetical protein